MRARLKLRSLTLQINQKSEGAPQILDRSAETFPNIKNKDYEKRNSKNHYADTYQHTFSGGNLFRYEFLCRCAMITKNFEIGELFVHCSTDEIETAVKDAQVMTNLQTLLCYLQAVRTRVGRPLVINSGYRDKAHNANVGGVKTSQHLKGEAVDCYVVGYGVGQLARLICSEFDYCFGQVIQYNTFIHLALQNEAHPRLQFIDKTKK